MTRPGAFGPQGSSMGDHVEFFGCRYPIVCAPMNQVSDAALAIAVHEAGAFPSLSIPNYIRNGRFEDGAYERELRAYKDATGSDSLLLSVGGPALLHERVMRPFLELGFRHVELFHWESRAPDWPQILERSRQLSAELGVRFVFKISTGHVTAGLDYPTLLLKGPEGAGRSTEDAPPLADSFDFCRQHLPTTKLIVSGGFHGAEQVSDYLSRGALAVAIGSLFAASSESAVAEHVKRKIIASSSADLKRMGDSRLQGLYTKLVDGDDRNLTRTLASGIRDAGDGGVFIGRAIDHITEILPVREIVRRLVAALA